MQHSLLPLVLKSCLVCNIHFFLRTTWTASSLNFCSSGKKKTTGGFSLIGINIITLFVLFQNVVYLSKIPFKAPYLKVGTVRSSYLVFVHDNMYFFVHGWSQELRPKLLFVFHKLTASSKAKEAHDNAISSFREEPFFCTDSSRIGEELTLQASKTSAKVGRAHPASELKLTANL